MSESTQQKPRTRVTQAVRARVIEGIRRVILGSARSPLVGPEGRSSSGGNLGSLMGSGGAGNTSSGSDAPSTSAFLKKHRWVSRIALLAERSATLIKRREISGSGTVAVHTLGIMRQLISGGTFKTVPVLLECIRVVGRVLVEANSNEIAIGNTVRRVLSIVRREVLQDARRCGLFRSGSRRKDEGGAQSGAGRTESKGDWESSESEGEIATPQLSSVQSRNYKARNNQAGVPSINGVGGVSEGEESKAGVEGGEMDLMPSLHTLLEDPFDSIDLRNYTLNPRIKQPVLTTIKEVMAEIENLYDVISGESDSHIYANETIMTHGVSRTVSGFLKHAAQARDFQVFCCESAPHFRGHQQAAVLSEEKKIDVTLITDASVFAMMTHVNKVIIGCHAVLANGGVVAHSGAYNICLAAKHFSVPVVVLSGLHKLCPLYAFDQTTFQEEHGPSQIFEFSEETVGKIQIENPMYDYVPPDLVTLFITNDGSFSPSYTYRLLQEFYSTTDNEL